MEVILLERIPKLGDMGEKVQVKPGFGRNYLIPRGKALAATRANVIVFESRRAALQVEAEARLAAARARALALEDLLVTIVANVGEEGRLFGSVTAQDIVAALETLGHRVDRHEIRFVEGPIRQCGDHTVELPLFGDEVVARVRVLVTAAS
ncbi:MAG: 50S ribosomal protein L9 [Gammaproteobacteria bacterium]|nr:50S ribosomal protein L9 [Gammaproteobacteria bacterium]MBP9728554.1 50S ribosomal protein L9 [Gammaproteobacteria bacterium]